jgi:hypothetical protein
MMICFSQSRMEIAGAGLHLAAHLALLLLAPPPRAAREGEGAAGEGEGGTGGGEAAAEAAAWGEGGTLALLLAAVLYPLQVRGRTSRFRLLVLW